MSQRQAKLEDDLRTLRLPRMADIHQEVLDKAARTGSSAKEVLTVLVGEELADRMERAFARRTNAARLPLRKTLEDYDFTHPQRVPKEKIARLFDCDFVERKENAVFIGPCGLGKTHLLVALGYRACECNIHTRFTRVVDMVNTLEKGHRRGCLAQALRAYTRPQLLLLDELGYLPIDKLGSDLMFQVISARYETGSIVISTNRCFREWGAIFDRDNNLATAMIDRLMHHGEPFIIQGESYRMKNKRPMD
jgi:DNA replication protein DnaC